MMLEVRLTCLGLVTQDLERISLLLQDCAIPILHDIIQVIEFMIAPLQDWVIQVLHGFFIANTLHDSIVRQFL